MPEFAGYKVTVLFRGHAHDAKSFPFGEWDEIGYWLDDAGYNRSSYTVQISFVDER